jgi:hypothetical protein
MSQETGAREGPNPVARFFGVLLIVAGVLVMGLCGLCSAGVLIASLASPGEEFSGLAMIPVVGIVGGVPIALGAGMFILGRQLAGPRRKRSKPLNLDTFS